MILTGKLVRLRPIEMTDLDRYLVWVNDDEVTRYLVFSGPISREEEEEFLKRRVTETSPPEIALAIEVLAASRHIGSVALHGISAENRHATLGIMIGDKTCWDRGYGSDAVTTLLRYGFEELRLQRIDLHVDERNARAIASYRKCGFVEEGRLRQHRFAEEQYWDTLVMSVLADEFVERHQRVT